MDGIPYILQLAAPTQNCSFPLGDLDPHLYMVPWARPSPQPKGRLDWFSCFAGLTIVTDRTATLNCVHPYT